MRVSPAISIRRGLWFALLLIAALAAHRAGAAEASWPELTGRVVDEAGLLSTAQRSDLDAKLAQIETATGMQLVVVTVNSLQGLEIEEYGVGLGRHWGIGQVGKNNGAMLIVAPNERAVRIEVGYGLEGVLTDAISSSIIQTDILPAFRAGRMDEGIIAGTDSILAALKGDYTPSKWSAPAESELRSQLQAQSQGDDLSFPFWIVPVIFISFWLAIVILAVRFGKKGKGSGSSGWTSSRSSSSFSSSGSSGGFSGGGGSFGGGGSTGRW
jgi:uncharacterized protein